MKVLVIGAGGMLGTKLIHRIAAEGKIGGSTVAELHRHDAVLCAAPPDAKFPISTEMSDLSIPGEAQKLLSGKPDLIFHLAAIVSGEAEENFDKGYAINLDGTAAIATIPNRICRA